MQTYTVKSGDTLSKIGASLGVDWKGITGFRSGDPGLIYPGEVLNIPETTTIAPTQQISGEEVIADNSSTQEQLAGAQAELKEKQTELHTVYTDAGISDEDATKLVDARGTVTPTDLGYNSGVIAKITGADNDVDQTTFNAGDLAGGSKLSDVLPNLAGAGTATGDLNVTSGIAGILALLETSSETDTEFGDINNKINTLLGSIEADKEGFEDTLAEYQVPEIQGQLNELNLDIARIKGEIGAFDAETQEGFAGITSQAIPQGLLVGQASAYQQQRDAGRAGKASELAANAALQQAYTQNLTIATGLAEASISYKWQGITNTLTALQTQLDLAQGVMEREDAKQLTIVNILLQDQMSQIDDQKAKETAMSTILLTAAGNGCPLNLIRTAEATGDSVQATLMLDEYLKESVERKTQVVEVDGEKKLIDSTTGEVIQDLGLAEMPEGDEGESKAEIAEALAGSKLVDDLLENPALDRITGVIQVLFTLPGTKPRLAEDQLKQIQAMLSLDNRQKLKGQGTITDYEAKMLAEAATILDRGLSTDEFKKELKRIKGVFDNAAGKDANVMITSPEGEAIHTTVSRDEINTLLLGNYEIEYE